MTTAPALNAAHITALFERCSIEFSRDQSIKAAHDAAATYCPDFDVLNAQFHEFLATPGGNLDDYVKHVQARNEPARFNLDRLARYEADIDPADFERLLNIACDGVHIPTPEPYRPAPPNPAPRKLTEQLGNTHVQHYMQAVAKGNCLCINPAQVTSAQLQGCAFMDHNWVEKRDTDGKPVAKGRVCIDSINVEGGDPINSPAMAAKWKELNGASPSHMLEGD